jgi:nickel-dependent lactate racemase
MPVRHLAQYYLSPIKEKADVVIVSQAGAPKDLNLYQTQKALDNAKHAVKDGGIVILIGSCKEGFGNAVFEEWMCRYQDPQAMIDALYQSLCPWRTQSSCDCHGAEKGKGSSWSVICRMRPLPEHS